MQPEKLLLALQRLEEQSISPAAKKAIAETLKAASNPDHGRVDVIVKSLPKERQRLIGKTAKAMQSITDDVMARGKQKLLDMDDSEWEQLVSDE